MFLLQNRRHSSGALLFYRAALTAVRRGPHHGCKRQGYQRPDEDREEPAPINESPAPDGHERLHSATSNGRRDGREHVDPFETEDVHETPPLVDSPHDSSPVEEGSRDEVEAHGGREQSARPWDGVGLAEFRDSRCSRRTSQEDSKESEEGGV